MGCMSHSEDLERKSSAVTLSDMEVFIFPELIYSLVLANIMSPRIWRWRDDPWFAGLERMKPYRRITRLKQYIMDHYMFNLDLDTWGLTTKERELARFSSFISEDTLARSNALFGYEGDKYYFDIDIRRHFGLDKYEGNVIPYWKTETVEAMDAFRFRPSYETGAGECVSLATLYAAALFVVARIPLEDIFLMATPLHSQNFIDLDDGILTNNRRLVTKNMWFNGTALSAQARRALENERVTVVSHISGSIHTVYDSATIDPAAYARFSAKLRDYLSSPLTSELLGNYLRQERDLQQLFQLRWPRHGMDHYIALERLFAYEHGSPYLLTDNTRDKLIEEVDSEELMHDPLADRIVFNDIEDFVEQNSITLGNPEHVAALKRQFAHHGLNAEQTIDNLIRFCHVEPRLPEEAAKRFAPEDDRIDIDLEMDREEIVEQLEQSRAGNRVADLAFYAFRDLLRTEPEPFLAAAVQRNPVSLEACSGVPAGELAQRLEAMPAESIYDEPGRLAQPDEVWNYGRGDGLEKAVLAANLLRGRAPDDRLSIRIKGGKAIVESGAGAWQFETSKGLPESEWLVPAE